LFARHIIEVALPLEIVAERLRCPGWLQPIWAAASERLSSEPMPGIEIDLPGRAVGGFEMGQPHSCSTSFLVPVFWEVLASSDLAVALDGDLRAASVSAVQTRLALQATYRNSSTEHADDVKRIATASVREVLVGVAESLAAIKTS